MKKIILLVVLLLFANNVSFALEADDSIDEIIKKNYNTENSSLPKLPKTSPKSIESQTFLDTGKTVSTPPKSINNSPSTTNTDLKNIPSVPQKINVKTVKVPKWKKINVTFSTAVSDSSPKGARVTFVSSAPLVAKNITLPAGTVFYGTVVKSHSPQILGNGGLVSVKTDYVVYNGKTSYCEGNIIVLNHDKVLFNNIKGKNGYVKGIKKVMRPAKTFYGKSLKVSKKLWNSPGFILAPITYLPGALFLAGDAVASPFIAMFHKGERAYVKKGSTATIRLTEPAYIEY